jgi:PAS domain S-box-containing protein
MDALHGAVGLQWAWTAADLGIGLLCIGLPLSLLRLLKHQPLDAAGGLLSASSLLVALAQGMDIWAVWQPDAAVRSIAGLVTAAGAALMAGATWRLMPRLPRLMAQGATDSQLQDMGRLGEVEAEARRLAAVVESSADAIVVKTLEGRITNWNAAAERMFGYTAAEAVGQPVQMLLPPEREAEEMHILASLAQGQQVPPFRTVRVAKDGRRLDISVQVSPLRDPAGRVIGGVKSARDLTHQRQIETALRQSEARLRFALESAGLGDWEMALDTGVIHRSRRHDQCFGLADSAQPWDRERLLAAVQADDRAAVAAGLQSLVDSSAPWHAEFRVQWPDGSLHWLRMDARVSHDGGGEPRLVGLVADVTATRTAEQAREQAVWLAAENRRVQESSRLKSLFLANMSHELRTPLNAIIGFSDLLSRDDASADPARQQQWLQHIASSGRHLLAMINDVLDLSKVEAGKLDFHPEPLDLPALVDEVMTTMAVLAAPRGIALSSSIAPELRDLVLDPARLKQVLLNYLSNAIKFTPAGGQVVLRMVGEGPQRWRLEVEDSGIGIPADRVGQLFVEFQQLDDGLSKRHQGTGLGLALTRRLVEAQGGRVGVYSDPGRGSRFYAVLPREATTAGAPAPHPDHQQLVALRDHPLRDGVARELAQAGVAADTTPRCCAWHACGATPRWPSTWACPIRQAWRCWTRCAAVDRLVTPQSRRWP